MLDPFAKRKLPDIGMTRMWRNHMPACFNIDPDMIEANESMWYVDVCLPIMVIAVHKKAAPLNEKFEELAEDNDNIYEVIDPSGQECIMAGRYITTMGKIK